jgi:hypothetical protein
LAITIPVETKLGQLLPNLGGGLLLELNPNGAGMTIRPCCASAPL